MTTIIYYAQLHSGGEVCYYLFQDSANNHTKYLLDFMFVACQNKLFLSDKPTDKKITHK